MAKCSALWNKCSRPKSTEKISEICGRSLPTPCATRRNSLYDSIYSLLTKRECFVTLMPALQLPCFKNVDLEFLDEHRQILAPIAVALDRLQGEKECYYSALLLTVLSVNTQLTQLQSVNRRHCVPLLTAITAGFQRRFADFLTLAPDINLATMTHP